MFCFGYLWEKPWWETPRPILQTTAATWGVCIWDIYLYRYPHLGMVHRQLARMDNVFPFHHLPGFKKCEPLKSERFANWNMIIFNGSWLNSMGRCPPLRRPTQSSAKLVFVTSAAVEIHGNPRRFEWATNLHCHLWWPEAIHFSILWVLIFIIITVIMIQCQLYNDLIWFVQGKWWGDVGWMFFFLTRWIWRLDASALSATHHLPRPWVASWGSHSGGVGSRKATTFTDDSWFMMIYLLEMVIVQRLYLEWFLCSLQ